MIVASAALITEETQVPLLITKIMKSYEKDKICNINASLFVF